MHQQEKKQEANHMQLVEQHCIRKDDPRYAIIDEAAFKSKNLYNAALYEMRQAFFHDGIYLNYNEIQHRMQSHEAYKALPAKVSQQVLMLLANNWESFNPPCSPLRYKPSIQPFVKFALSLVTVITS
jgi:putative transposase